MKKVSLILILFIITISLTSFIIIKAYDKDKINILVYGVDGRENDEIERSDVIILMNYNFSNGSITATSIPRDSYVKITCKDNAYDKVNHAYAFGGEECLNETVKQLFDIKDLKNIMFNFENVVEIVDYFGYIELTPNFTFCQSDESFTNKYCFEKGKKILADGKQVLAYMRNRKSLPNGDFDRIKNQRQVLQVLIEKVLKLSVIDKIKFYNYFKKRVDTDIGLDDLNIKKLINIKQIKLNEYTLKGEGFIDTYYYYKLDQEHLEKIKKYYI